MAWIPRVVRPYAHKISRLRARYDTDQPTREWPERRFETLKGRGPLVLAVQSAWQDAPLTDEARDAFAQCNLEFWSVRLPGTETPFAIIVRPCLPIHQRGCRGEIVVSQQPELVLMRASESTLVVAGSLVFCCGGSTSVEGLQFLCHALDDTHIGGEPYLDFRRRDVRLRPIPAADAAALASLAL